LDYVGLIAELAAGQDEEKVEIQFKNGFVTAAQTGMGLCLLKRRVVEEMITRRVVTTDGRPSTVSP
jgi:hypothetical protein